MIIDAHAHLGYDYAFEEDSTLEDLLAGIEKNRIDVTIVQPGTVFDLRTVAKQHNAIAALARKMPSRIFGMANPNPHLPSSKYNKEIERCIEDLGFVGVKLHPLGHAVNPCQPAGKKVFEAARKLEIPVMVHTGTGIPWALPSTLIEVAMDYPDLDIILAHSGSAIFRNEAALAARLCPRIYLETSWMPTTAIHSFVKTLGADRIMFGSDVAKNVATELEKFRSIGLTEEELKWCLGGTAAKVFKLGISLP